MVMSSLFPQGGRNSTLSSEGTPHEASQSSHGSDRGSSISASHRDQSDGGGTGARDKPAAVDDTSNNIQAV